MLKIYIFNILTLISWFFVGIYIFNIFVVFYTKIDILHIFSTCVVVFSIESAFWPQCPACEGKECLFPKVFPKVAPWKHFCRLVIGCQDLRENRNLKAFPKVCSKEQLWETFVFNLFSRTSWSPMPTSTCSTFWHWFLDFRWNLNFQHVCSF